MSSSLQTKAPADTVFVCACETWMLTACEGLTFYKKYEDKQYCVLHYPGKEKVAVFNEALKRKLDAEDFKFYGVWFPDNVDFGRFKFTKSTSFAYATFSGTAYFISAVFSAAVYFNSTTFSEWAAFDYVTFGAEVVFSSAKFNESAYFGRATFRATADFSLVTFSNYADFRSITFEDYVRFAGDEKRMVFGDDSSLSLWFARIEKPDRLSFHTLTLRPEWFVNVDARKFEFINVGWNWRGLSIKLQRRYDLPRHRLLAIACRNLAVNAEENHRYEEASRFRYMAMDARRLERWRGFVPWRLSWWYWLASGYGERVWRAFVVLIGVWLLAAALYTLVGFVRWEPRVSNEKEAVEVRRDEVGQPLRGWRPLTYSLGVMTLQKPEPRPATDAAQAVVMLETILGPVQAALLALAIRRKFMR